MADKKHLVKVLNIKEVTHDVKSFRLEKPNDYKFTPGQATHVSINKPSLDKKRRPFTFTSLNSDSHLEFTIKMYKDHEDGMTKHLFLVREGDEFIIENPWGSIQYKGPGVFIAGGAGVTPFIAILRDLRKKEKLHGNTLIFSNKTSNDIILEPEFKEMESEGLKCIFTLTQENKTGYENKRIDETFLKEKISDFQQNFYICGPVRMVGEIQSTLKNLGASPDSVVLES